MSKIIALDLSTKRSGYALYDTESKEVSYGVIASASTSVEKRITIMRDGLINIMKEFKPDVIVAEDVVPGGQNAHTGKVLTWLQGVIAVASYEVNSKRKFELLGASTWRSKLGLQGYRVTREQQKKKDIEYAAAQFHVDLDQNADDEADALCILAAYLGGVRAETTVKKVDPIGEDWPSAF